MLIGRSFEFVHPNSIEKCMEAIESLDCRGLKNQQYTYQRLLNSQVIDDNTFKFTLEEGKHRQYVIVMRGQFQRQDDGTTLVKGGVRIHNLLLGALAYVIFWLFILRNIPIVVAFMGLWILIFFAWHFHGCRQSAQSLYELLNCGVEAE